jgi:hypothetical protein
VDDRPSVLLVVEPRLLADTLTVMLETHGWEVCRAPIADRRQSPRQPARPFDLAIVAEAPPRDAAPELVLRLSPEGTLCAADREGREVDLLAALRRLRSDPAGHERVHA